MTPVFENIPVVDIVSYVASLMASLLQQAQSPQPLQPELEKPAAPVVSLPFLTQSLGVHLTLFAAEQPSCTAAVLETEQPLFQTIPSVCARAMAQFPRENLDQLGWSIHFLSPLLACPGAESFVPGQQGLLLSARGRTSFCLPQEPVQQGWSALGTLEKLCSKAALPPGTWRDRTAQLFSFETARLNYRGEFVLSCPAA